MAACVSELRIIGTALAEKKIDLWPLVCHLAASLSPDPDAEQLERIRDFLSRFVARLYLDLPPLRFYTVEGVMLDYACFLARQRQEAAERQELERFANTAEWSPRSKAFYATLTARRDARLWDDDAQTWRPDPPADLVAREILFCHGLPRIYA